MKPPKKQINIEQPEKKKVTREQALGSRSGSLPGSGPVSSLYDVGPVEPHQQAEPEAAPKVRFEATIHAGLRASAGRIDQLDIDRVPGAKGEVRALVTPDECVRLLDEGFEVRLHHAHPVRPLDPALIETDDSVLRRLHRELGNLARPTGRKKSKRGKRT